MLKSMSEIEFLKKLIEQIDTLDLESKSFDSPEFKAWYDSVLRHLDKLFRTNSTEYRAFLNIKFNDQNVLLSHPAYSKGLVQAKITLKNLVQQLETVEPKIPINSKELFISYSNKDKEIAGELSKLIKSKGYEVFLAHEIIEVNEYWRNEIRKHLDSCRGLIAIVTDNFQNSQWTNQECGYIMGTKKPIVSLFYPRKEEKSGFLEERQGITIHDEIIKQIDNIIKPFG